MLNLVEIGFGNDKSRSKKNPNTKIYENGNIIISRPQSSKNPYTILSIKKYKSSSNLKINKNLNKSYKKKIIITIQIINLSIKKQNIKQLKNQ